MVKLRNKAERKKISQFMLVIRQLQLPAACFDTNAHTFLKGHRMSTNSFSMNDRMGPPTMGIGANNGVKLCS